MNVPDPEAISRLWHEHADALVLYARQWCDAPEDAVQEAFWQLARQAVWPENPTGWLYRVVRRRAINAVRSRGRRARRETAVASRGEPWFEANVGDRLDAAAATEALKCLPIDQREAIIARLWGGLSFDQIATASDCSLSRVYRSYRRGIAALRERLEGSCPTKRTKTTISQRAES
jgi:RNA polymerase sigma factor (sigma-70 family)